MSEKRFYLNQGEVNVLKIIDFKEDNEGIYRTTSESDMKIIVEILNELDQENQALKKDIAKYKEKENKQPKNRRITEKPNCGYCKYLQIDGMFGMWCDKGRNWENTDAEYCPDYER